MTPRGAASLEDRLVRRARPAVEWVRVEGETIAWNADTEELHRLDPIATLIFDLCDGTTTLAAVVTDLSMAFGLEASQIEIDVLSGTQLLLDAGLLVRN